MSIEYTYAVARIRSKELSLLSKYDLDSLMNCKDYNECIKYLQDKGWGDGKENITSDKMLSLERDKTWQLMQELVGDLSPFDVFLVSNDFHNLKVSLKAITRNVSPSGMLLSNGTVSPTIIYDAIKKREYSNLPKHLEETAKTALNTLLQTSDGQLCDVIIDKAALLAIVDIGEKSKNEIIKKYSEITVASANIKMAVRCEKTGKSIDFIKNCLAPCSSLNTELLARAANKSAEDIYACISSTDYSGAIDALKSSPSAFEKWCDDLLINQMKLQKWEPFSIGPLVAYVVARENEIKAVRIILSGKLNKLNVSMVQERLREMYV